MLQALSSLNADFNHEEGAQVLISLTQEQVKACQAILSNEILGSQLWIRVEAASVSFVHIKR